MKTLTIRNISDQQSAAIAEAGALFYCKTTSKILLRSVVEFVHLTENHLRLEKKHNELEEKYENLIDLLEQKQTIENDIQEVIKQ